MKIAPSIVALVFALGPGGLVPSPAAAQVPKPAAVDPLPSWNEGAAKAAIREFVARTTGEHSPEFLPPVERIAVFDNDGTLWPEDPVPFELAFTFDAARARMAKTPGLGETPAYKALASGDIARLTEGHLKLLRQLIGDTHAGQTTDEFHRAVAEWIATARHPRFHRLYADCTYLPMQELLKFLRASGYKTYIVSGGTADFMRAWALRVYGIPPEQVIGSVFKTRYEFRGDRPSLRILPELALVDDRGGKPVGIHHFIGRHPVMCFGNSDGDHEMLQWTTIGRGPSFGMIVHHTDADREYAYDANPKGTGKLVEALAAAPKRGWSVVDMKKDWKTIFTRQD